MTHALSRSLGALLAVACALVPALAAPPPAYTLPVGERWKATQPDTVLGQAAGFYYARLTLAEKMIEAQPELASDLKSALMSFRAQYEPGYNAIISELVRRDPNFRQEFENAVKPAMAKQFEGKTFTKEEVQNALKGGTFNPRAQMGTERSMLCAMNPAYVERPFHEFNEGFVLTSFAGISGDDARRVAVTHPVSWGRVDTGGKSLILTGALGAGPLVFKLDVYRADDTQGPADGAALKALLEKYGPKPAQGVTFGDIRLNDAQTTATRSVVSTTTTQAQTMRSIGRYSASVKDGLLMLSLVSCVAPVDPANPTGDDAQIEALHGKFAPVLGKVTESMRVEAAPAPAAPAAPGR